MVKIVILKLIMIQDACVRNVIPVSRAPLNVFESPEVSITTSVLLLELHGSWYHYYSYDLNTNQTWSHLRILSVCWFGDGPHSNQEERDRK